MKNVRRQIDLIADCFDRMYEGNYLHVKKVSTAILKAHFTNRLILYRHLELN